MLQDSLVSERRLDRHKLQILLDAVLEDAELGVVVIEGRGHIAYLNAAARRLLGAGTAQPLTATWSGWLAPLLERVGQGGTRVVDRWIVGELVLRVRARALDPARQLVALELTVEQAPGNGSVADRVARALALSMPDARLLGFVWRGLSNDDIARTLGVRVGTVKSRLFRLYQRLGVCKRATAVLRAAQVLQEPTPVAA